MAADFTNARVYSDRLNNATRSQRAHTKRGEARRKARTLKEGGEYIRMHADGRIDGAARARFEAQSEQMNQAVRQHNRDWLTQYTIQARDWLDMDPVRRGDAMSVSQQIYQNQLLLMCVDKLRGGMNLTSIFQAAGTYIGLCATNPQFRKSMDRIKLKACDMMINRIDARAEERGEQPGGLMGAVRGVMASKRDKYVDKVNDGRTPFTPESAAADFIALNMAAQRMMARAKSAEEAEAINHKLQLALDEWRTMTMADDLDYTEVKRATNIMAWGLVNDEQAWYASEVERANKAGEHIDQEWLDAHPMPYSAMFRDIAEGNARPAHMQEDVARHVNPLTGEESWDYVRRWNGDMVYDEYVTDPKTGTVYAQSVPMEEELHISVPRFDSDGHESTRQAYFQTMFDDMHQTTKRCFETASKDGYDGDVNTAMRNMAAHTNDFVSGTYQSCRRMMLNERNAWADGEFDELAAQAVHGGIGYAQGERTLDDYGDIGLVLNKLSLNRAEVISRIGNNRGTWSQAMERYDADEAKALASAMKSMHLEGCEQLDGVDFSDPKSYRSLSINGRSMSEYLDRVRAGGVAQVSCAQHIAAASRSQGRKAMDDGLSVMERSVDTSSQRYMDTMANKDNADNMRKLCAQMDTLMRDSVEHVAHSTQGEPTSRRQRQYDQARAKFSGATYDDVGEQYGNGMSL